MIQCECDCGRVYEFPDEKVGRKVRCKHCGAKWRVPAATSEPKGSGADRGASSLAVAGGAVVACVVLAVSVYIASSARRVPRARTEAPAERPATSGKLQRFLAPREAAMRDIEVEALATGAPTGLLGAKWLMSRPEVGALFPDVAEGVNDQLQIEATVYGRAAKVDFSFQKGTLLLIIVTFMGSASRTEFDRTQALLSQEYGPMPAPVVEGAMLVSTRKIGRFCVAHQVFRVFGLMKEQVSLYRSK